jgi:polyhydroxyalkanoate synthesis regulator protein
VNRKLYDTVESRYVTLDEIAHMIKLGDDVLVVEERTERDLTAVTLLPDHPGGAEEEREGVTAAALPAHPQRNLRGLPGARACSGAVAGGVEDPP